ncbi:MAG: HlyD family efflux transporter periplasmic adaptor subunit [Prevotella sp.]|nr:HlyD family efflux transporter periplasmic adaptor subunit [Prevotella sp.]MBR6494386.1 HlyD family efflux transporter periplasmic adaptor subunit [Prevotella sp.]
MENQEKIELRSENLRNFIGQVPPILTRIGTAIVSVLFIALCFAAYKIPYPFTVEAQGIVLKSGNSTDELSIRLSIPYKNYSHLQKNLELTATLEGVDNMAIVGKIDSISDKIVTQDGDNYFYAYSRLKKEIAAAHRLQPNMKATATIVIDNKTVWQRVFKK